MISETFLCFLRTLIGHMKGPYDLNLLITRFHTYIFPKYSFRIVENNDILLDMPYLLPDSEWKQF